MNKTVALIGMGIGIGLMVLGIVLIVQSTINTNRFNDWAKQCRTDGGITSLDGVQDHFIFGVSVHYECIKDGKVINHVN